MTLTQAMATLAALGLPTLAAGVVVGYLRDPLGRTRHGRH